MGVKSARKTAKRKLRQGVAYQSHAPRWKVPPLLRPFVQGASPRQGRARFDVFATAIGRYNKHREETGKGPTIRTAPAGE